MIGIQQSFQELRHAMATTRYSLGGTGEVLIAQRLQERGYLVNIDHKRGDLRVISQETGELWGVEIKTARKCKDHKWRFLLWKKGEQDHRKADVVVLVCVTKPGDVYPFVVPISELQFQRQAVITSFPPQYKGKLAVYRQRIECLSIERAFEVSTHG